jgi:hypothetical protein
MAIELKEWARQSPSEAPVAPPDLATKATSIPDLDEVRAMAKHALATTEKRSLTLVKPSTTGS